MDKKLLKWNFVFQYGWVLTNIFNSLLLTPLYLKNIHADTLGIWWATGSVLGWMTLVDPGVGEVLQQRIAELRGRMEKTEVGKLVGSGYAMSVLVLGVSVVIGVAAYFFLGKIINKDISAYANLSTALVITIVATGLTLVSFTLIGINQGLHNSAQVAVSSLAANLLFLLVNLLFLFLGWGVLSIAMANLFRAVYINIHNIAAMLRLLKKEGISIEYQWSHLKRFGRIFSFTSTSKIITGLSYSIDMIVLARFTPGVITLYEVNRRPINHFYALVGRHSVALMPLISHAKGQGQKESILALLKQQFKFYSYATLFLTLFFCFNYNFLISAWIGPENFIGTSLLYLLAAQFFVSLMAIFMANVSYALGDIKKQSLYNIVRGVVFGTAMYGAAKYAGVKGVIIGSLVVSLLFDFFFFYFRVYKLGYLQRTLFTGMAVAWLVMLSVAGLVGWGLTILVNKLLASDQYFAKLLVNGGTFTLFFFLLLLAVDVPFRSRAKALSGKYVMLPFARLKRA